MIASFANSGVSFDGLNISTMSIFSKILSKLSTTVSPLINSPLAKGLTGIEFYPTISKSRYPPGYLALPRKEIIISEQYWINLDFFFLNFCKWICIYP